MVLWQTRRPPPGRRQQPSDRAALPLAPRDSDPVREIIAQKDYGSAATMTARLDGPARTQLDGRHPEIRHMLWLGARRRCPPL